eukprot:950767-Pleurochrysis_carterae.AAC.2
MEVPEFAAVPIELRREASSSPASDRGETESAAKRIFGRALEASADLLAQGDEQMTHRGTPTTPLNARSREGTGLAELAGAECSRSALGFVGGCPSGWSPVHCRTQMRLDG